MKAQLKLNWTRTAIWLSLLLLTGLKLSGEGLPKKNDKYAIKSCAYWTKPTMSLSEVENLSKYDILIVDLENKFNNYQILMRLKSINPRLKLLCYSNPMEIFLTKYANRPWQNKIIDELTSTRSSWLLKIITENSTKSASMWEKIQAYAANKPTKKEAYATFWSGMTMINVSSSCPEVNGENYSDWIRWKFLSEILSDPIWNGYFMDNGTANISWTHPGKIDIDGDKKADSDEFVDHKWKQGMENFLAKIRQAKGKNFLIISNKGDLNFTDKVNGKFFEKYPNDYLGDKWAGGFRQCLKNAEKTGNYTVFQANRSNIKFVLAASLLLDNVYLAISQDDAGYFPELNIDTGKPLGRYEVKKGIYYRHYEKAEIMVDPLKQTGQITIKK